MNEPARDLNANSAAQDELESILREAEAARQAGPRLENPERLGPPPGPMSKARRAAAEAAAAQLAEGGVKLERHEFVVDLIPFQVPIVLALAVVALALWIFAPQGAPLLRAPAIPGSFLEASARLTLALTLQRIDRFESEQGRLPQSLDELDPNLSDVVTYQRLLNGGCLLQATGPDGVISLQSRAPLEPFLSHGSQQLRHRPGATP